MVEEGDKENRVQISPGDPQQLEIITVGNHQPHMSIDELLAVIKGANGMPVLFIPSGDGRLAALAVDGLQNLVPPGTTTRNEKGNGSDEKKEQPFRSWLLFLTSLSADDKVNEYVAGTSIMRDKFRTRYTIFKRSNMLAFFTSLMIIGSLAKNRNDKKLMTVPLLCLVGACFMSLGTSFVSGTWDGPKDLAIVGAVFVINILYLFFPWELVLGKLKH
ncbi:hypothetical protein VPH35_071159 [Triticum aestivum]